MLAQNFQRKDAKMQRRNEENDFVNTAGTHTFLRKPNFNKRSFLPFASLLLCVFALNLFSLSCTTNPSDLRSLVPGETLVYLETNDLAAALQPIVDSKPFSSVVTKKPDFSALKGVQVAVAVTGFETSEVVVTDEQSVGKVQPRFVAVADTHAWNYQAVAFAEKKLGSFVTEIYDSEPKLEKSDKHGGKYFTWTSQDGRKAFALVIDSLIYFGNDESAIDKAVSVRSGQADSIAKTGKLPPHVPGNLASGYVSTDGVAQIAALAGLHFASQASDEEEVQSAVAGILPQLIRGTVTDVSWSTSQTSEGIEDKWSVTMPSELTGVLTETMAPGDGNTFDVLSQLPKNVPSVTVYKLKNPQVAWRALLLTAQKLLDPMAGKILGESSSLFFEPYGIRDPESFLNSVGSTITTASFDIEGEKSVVISEVRDMPTVKASFLTEIKPQKESWPNTQFEQWRSADGDYAAAFANSWVIVGDTESVGDCLSEKPDGGFGLSLSRKPSNDSKASVISFGKDPTATLQVVNLLAREGHGDTQVVSTYLTETRFTKTGMERRTVSDLGFIGWMIAQLAAE